jgi:hypothetical protein
MQNNIYEESQSTPKCSRKTFLINEIKITSDMSKDGKIPLIDQLNVIKTRANNLIGKLITKNKIMADNLNKHSHSKSNLF